MNECSCYDKYCIVYISASFQKCCFYISVSSINLVRNVYIILQIFDQIQNLRERYFPGFDCESTNVDWTSLREKNCNRLVYYFPYNIGIHWSTRVLNLLNLDLKCI